jgi:hypothetical protein
MTLKDKITTVLCQAIETPDKRQWETAEEYSEVILSVVYDHIETQFDRWEIEKIPGISKTEYRQAKEILKRLIK